MAKAIHSMIRMLDEACSGGFFQVIPGGLVVGLCNLNEVWPVSGCEGESFSKEAATMPMVGARRRTRP
jgi:hypothetical protein